MVDIIGPIFVIIMVFIIYHFAGKMDIAGDVKIKELELSKIDAETKQEEVRGRNKELDIQMGKLAIEAKKLGFDTKTTDIEYRFLEDSGEVDKDEE